MDRKQRLATAALLPLLLAGCGEPPLPLQVMDQPSPVNLDRFEGRWFEPEGNLIAVFSGGPEPRYSVLFPGFRLQTGAGPQDELLFSFRTRERQVLYAWKLVGENEAVLNEIPTEESTAECCACGPLRGLPLLRNPSPLWFLKLHAGRIEESARQAHEAAFDRLARIL